MFYTYIDEELFSGPMVTFPDGEILLLEFKDDYTYPVQGWYYFATEQEAKDFYGIKDEV